MNKEKFTNIAPQESHEPAPDNEAEILNDPNNEDLTIRTEMGPEEEERIKEIIDSLSKEGEALAGAIDLGTDEAFEAMPEGEAEEVHYEEGGLIRKLNKKIRDHAKAFGLATVMAGFVAANADNAEAGPRYHDNSRNAGRQILETMTRDIARGINIERYQEIRQMEIRIREVENTIRSIDREARIAANQLGNAVRRAGIEKRSPEDLRRLDEETQMKVSSLFAERDRLLAERQQLIKEYRQKCMKWDIVSSISDVISGITR